MSWTRITATSKQDIETAIKRRKEARQQTTINESLENADKKSNIMHLSGEDLEGK